MCHKSPLLSIVVRKKEKYQTLILELSDKISRMEAHLKCSQAVKIAKKLADPSSLLLEELYKRARQCHVLS